MRLFKEVRAAGYPGSYNQVKRYARKVRPQPAEEPVVRFETPPAHQAQVDFADFQLPWGERYAFLVDCNMSRAPEHRSCADLKPARPVLALFSLRTHACRKHCVTRSDVVSSTQPCSADPSRGF